MSNESTIIDVSHVTCGLVPLMETHLGGQDPDVEQLDFKIRQGIHTELWNAFGAGGDWTLSGFTEELFHDIAHFKRAEKDYLDPLGLMDF